MTQSDSLLVEDRSKHTVLVIDGNQLSGCNALEGLRGMDVTWVTSLEDAAILISKKKFDFILSSPSASEERGGRRCRLEAEIAKLAFASRSPLCFISRTDYQGNEANGHADHLTLRAASAKSLAESMPLVQRSKSGDGLLAKMKFTATYMMPGTARTPEIWSKGIEMLKAMCLRPKIDSKPPAPVNGRRLTPVPGR